jgi:hypothetical protein
MLIYATPTPLPTEPTCSTLLDLVQSLTNMADSPEAVAETAIDPVLEHTLDPPLAAGIHEIDLATLGVELDAGRQYRWFVSTSTGADSEAIERILLESTVRDEIDRAAPGDRGRLYAARGLWYDALGFISALIDEQPQESRFRELRSELLESAGLDAAAAVDRGLTTAKPAP